MTLRKVNKKLLIKSAVCYRLLTIVLEFFVLWIVFGRLKEAGMAAVIWNVINIGWYYTYHYWFARHYKIGE